MVKLQLPTWHAAGECKTMLRVCLREWQQVDLVGQGAIECNAFVHALEIRREEPPQARRVLLSCVGRYGTQLSENRLPLKLLLFAGNHASDSGVRPKSASMRPVLPFSTR